MYFADWLIPLLMSLDKHNLITAKTMGLIFALLDFASAQDVLFANHSSSNACIMVLPNLTFVSFVLHSFFHCQVGGNLQYTCYGFILRLG